MAAKKSTRRMRGNKTLLTVADIRALEAEIQADRARRVVLDKAIYEKTVRLNAAKLFLPDAVQPKTPTRAKSKAILKSRARVPTRSRVVESTRPSEPRMRNATVAAHSSWSDDIVAVMTAQTEGISYKDLLAQVINRCPERPRSAGDKGFYHAIRRLTKADQLWKARNGLVYTRKLLQEMAERGESVPARTVGRGGSSAIVIGILNDAPKGLTGPELTQRASKHPDAPASLRTYKHYIYNILSGLRKNGVVLKDGDTYKLATAGHAVH